MNLQVSGHESEVSSPVRRSSVPIPNKVSKYCRDQVTCQDQVTCRDLAGTNEIGQKPDAVAKSK